MSLSLNNRSSRNNRQQVPGPLSSLLSDKRSRKIVAPIIAIGIFLLIWQIFSASPDASTLR